VPTPTFEWKQYEVPAEAGDGGPELVEAEAAAATVTVAIPDLGAFHSPLAKAKILLESAAEVEHALMVQYLYAAYSLKKSNEVADPALQAALLDTSETSWPQVLLGIAREEMGKIVAAASAEERAIDTVRMAEIGGASVADPGWPVAAPYVAEAAERGVDAKPRKSSVTTDRQRIGRRTDDAERHAQAVFVRPLKQGGADAARLVLRRDEQVSQEPQVIAKRRLREADGGAAVACDPGAGRIVLLQEGDSGCGCRGRSGGGR